jgi:hypothetical protein
LTEAHWTLGQRDRLNKAMHITVNTHICKAAAEKRDPLATFDATRKKLAAVRANMHAYVAKHYLDFDAVMAYVERCRAAAVDVI